jgi:hypothetical protein
MCIHTADKINGRGLEVRKATFHCHQTFIAATSFA